ncbi:MAG: beta-N-acetylhexosaminidase [Clostridia bacterium]|nr:beta-N-acetylhexosaminidase [Clostridia bacterium]
MAKNYESLGVMIDFSRNGVMTVPALKTYLTTLRKMGYNTLFLYMEDTYEVEGEPYFGYMRSRYSIEEMKEIDEFCASVGIEAIPCIQTLAHMKTFFKWDAVPTDCDDILLAGDERTYTLIENMFKTLSSCFRSKRIHIGMDEAHLLGKGKYYHLHGHVPSSQIIKEHLDRIVEIAKPYGYDLLLWSDMFFRIWNSDGYYVKEYTEIPKEVTESLPDSVKPVYWDYYHLDEETYDVMLRMHKQFGGETWFAGGDWSWAGFAPLNDFSIRTMREAMKACRKNKTKNIFFTMWGDDGMECSHFSQLPSLLYIAEYARGNYDEEKIKAKFKRITGVDFDTFMLTDIPNKIDDSAKTSENPSKYLLYSDPFLGFLDYTVASGIGGIYAEHTRALAEAAKKTRKYGYLFNTLAALCDVLSIKAELGTKIRAAYKAADKVELARIANEDCTALIKKTKVLHRAFERQWYLENKPSGFEVHDGRMGALMQRLDSCKRRLLLYCDGKLDRIEELECDLLPLNFGRGKGKAITYTCYGRIVTANQFTHSL